MLPTFLTLFTFIVPAMIIICNRFIKKVTNSYFFWLITASFVLTWIIVFRFVPAWQTCYEWYDTGRLNDLSNTDASNVLSKALALDVCPFCAWALPVCLIADPSRRAARTLCPVSIFGAFFSLAFLIVSDAGADFSWDYMFVGHDLFYFLHVSNLLLAIGVLLNTPKQTKKNCLWSLYGTGIMFTYIMIVTYATGCQYHVSGVTGLDFSPQGEYWVVTSKIGFIPWQFMPIVFYPISALGIYGLALGFNKLKDFHWFSVGQERADEWYKGYILNK